MFPYQNMPYGLPPAYCYPLTEICMFVLLILTFMHAWKKGTSHVSYLLGGIGFGLLLEYVNVVSNAGYKYGQFTVMLGHAPDNIPVCIGVGWGVIIYTARLVSDKMGLALWAAAAFDALLAISIDLGMDIVAYRLHMWHWNWEERGFPDKMLTADWFGIPYGNFFGWLCVVFFYSLFARTLEKTKVWKPVIPLLSILISQVVLWVSLFPVSKWLKTSFGIGSKERVIFLLILFPVMAYLGFRRKRTILKEPLPSVTWLVPIWFHLYFFAWFLMAGMALENKLMTMFCFINLLVGLTIHWLIHNRKLRTDEAGK